MAWGLPGSQRSPQPDISLDPHALPWPDIDSKSYHWINKEIDQ